MADPAGLDSDPSELNVKLMPTLVQAGCVLVAVESVW